MKTYFHVPQATHPERLFAMRYLPQGGAVLDLGCGKNKTIPAAIGIDVQNCTDRQGSADDLSEFQDNTVAAIISRHSLEHLLDPIAALREWHRVLVPNGLAIIVLPDHAGVDTMHPVLSRGTHLHAYTGETLANLIRTLGWFTFDVPPTVILENWSFGTVLRKR